MLISGEPNMGLRNWRNILNSDPSIELLHFTILRPPSKRDLDPCKGISSHSISYTRAIFR